MMYSVSGKQDFLEYPMMTIREEEIKRNQIVITPEGIRVKRSKR